MTMDSFEVFDLLCDFSEIGKNSMTVEDYFDGMDKDYKEGVKNLFNEAVKIKILDVKDGVYTLTHRATVISNAEESIEYAVLEWIDYKNEMDGVWTKKEMYDDFLFNDEGEVDLAIERLQDKGLIDGEYNFTKAGRWILDGEHDFETLSAML